MQIHYSDTSPILNYRRSLFFWLWQGCVFWHGYIWLMSPLVDKVNICSNAMIRQRCYDLAIKFCFYHSRIRSRSYKSPSSFAPDFFIIISNHDSRKKEKSNLMTICSCHSGQICVSWLLHVSHVKVKVDLNTPYASHLMTLFLASLTLYLASSTSLIVASSLQTIQFLFLSLARDTDITFHENKPIELQ
jgi:hypothetical protein